MNSARSAVQKDSKMNIATFVGLHIPKCAGTSFLEMAQSALPPDRVYQNTSIIKNWNQRNPEFLDILDHKRLRLLWGHHIHEQMLYFFDRPILFTGLRDPVDRLKSAVRYQIALSGKQGREQPDVQALLAKMQNPICWFIIRRFPTLSRSNSNLTPFGKARTALTAFHHVYFTENFEESANSMLMAMGINTPILETNVSKLPDIDFDIDRRLVEHDLELYDWAEEHFGPRKFDSDINMPSSLAEFLRSRPNLPLLESFLFQAQANEYADWGKIDEVIDAKLAEAERTLREIQRYRIKARDDSAY